MPLRIRMSVWTSVSLRIRMAVWTSVPLRVRVPMRVIVRRMCSMVVTVAATAVIVARMAIVMRKRIGYTMRNNLTRNRILALMRMRMPPQHELFYNEKHAETNNQRIANRMRTAGANSLHCLRQQTQQRRADQRTRGKAHEVREHAHAGLLGKQ